jgi:hypothetical protein
MRWIAALLLVAGCGVQGPPRQCPSPLRAPARSQVTPVLVPTTNQVYVLGGQSATGPLDELWRWSFGSCGGWERLTLASSPGPRAGYAAAFDDSRHRIVYIGGGGTNDVWALDTDRLTFTKLAPTGTPPVAAVDELAAYDAMHDRIIYAGVESWTLDFSGSEQGQWIFADPFTVQPPAASTVDPTRSLFLVLDAVGLHGYSLLTSTWRDLTVHGDVPPAGARLVWDSAGKQLIAVADGTFIGALDANGNSATFTAMATTGDPPARTGFALAISGDQLWLFGGVTAAGCPLDDVWTLDLSSGAWSNVWPATTCQ